MKFRLILSLVCSLVVVSTYGQMQEAAQRVKYITKAPDGSESIVIYDDYRDNIMQLESENRFYKFQLLDLRSGQPVFTQRKSGNRGVILKSEIKAGDYYLRVFTNHFIITTKIAIRHTPSLLAENKDLVAIVD